MRPLTASGYVVVTVVILSFISLAVGSGHLNVSQHRRVRGVLSEAAKTCVLASQDRNPFLASVHASQGMATASALRQLMGDDVIRRKCGLEVGEIIERCAAQQRKAMKRMQRVAPKVALKGHLGYVVE